MAKHEVPSGQEGVHDVELTPAEIDEVIFLAPIPAAELFVDGSAWVYYTIDGSTPVVGSMASRSIPPVVSIRTIDFSGLPGPGQKRVVKLLSAGAPVYALTRTAAVGSEA